MPEVYSDMSLLQELQNTFENGKLEIRINDFLRDNIGGFAFGEEQTHENFSIYKDFVELMESFLLDFVEVAGLQDIEEAYAVIREEAEAEDLDALKRSGDKSFIQTILASFEYDKFCEVMSDYKREVVSGEAPGLSDQAGVSDTAYFFSHPTELPDLVDAEE